MPKGNKHARGTKGNKGGGRKPLPSCTKKSKMVRVSPRLWNKIQLATKESFENDWRIFLEILLDTHQSTREETPSALLPFPDITQEKKEYA